MDTRLRCRQGRGCGRGARAPVIHYGRSGDGVEATLTTVPRDAPAPGGGQLSTARRYTTRQGSSLYTAVTAAWTRPG